VTVYLLHNGPASLFL